MNHSGKNYGEMGREELERELREAFLDTDIIDGPLNDELEKMRETLDRKWPVEAPHTPEEAWARFLEDKAEELAPFFAPGAGASPRPVKPAGRRPRTARILRGVLIAAAVVVLLAVAALAADSLGLVAWAPRWNGGGFSFAATDETIPRAAILTALEQLEIHEPVYPGKLPEGFVPMESQFSEDPFILFEQYGDGERYLSITVIPASSFETAVYQEKNETIREYRSGNVVHYLFNNVGAITAVWYTENYFTSISGNISISEMMRMIDSVYAR